MATLPVLFPDGFLWGTATAAHQVEGGNVANDWHDWEQAGRTLGMSGLACDWWGGRWSEDFDRAARAGQNTHRLSVEWSRIEPEPGRWDEVALERYHDIVAAAVQRGLAPMVTLHHFTNPRWLAKRGGWADRETPALFARFAEKVAGRLKDCVSLWCTINEPNVYAYSAFMDGIFPPGRRNPLATLAVMANLVRGHALAYRAVHRVQPSAKVGLAMHYRSFHPARGHLLNGPLARQQSRLFNDAIARAVQTGTMDQTIRRVAIPEAEGTQDFIGVNYYTRVHVAFDPRRPSELFGRNHFRDGAELSASGFIANEPDGFAEALRWGAAFGVPVIVTENGVEDADDVLRPAYLLEHVRQVADAISRGIDVRGYYHWTLVDNFEWERGWSQRFGLWALNVATQERTARPSAELYREICRANCVRLEVAQRYAPRVAARWATESDALTLAARSPAAASQSSAAG